MAGSLCGFSRQQRLRRSGDFRRLQRVGRRSANSAFVVLVSQDDDAWRGKRSSRCRLGVTVSRKVGNAVVRNHVKRRIREWFRSVNSAVGVPVDIVVIARQAAAALTGAETAAALSKLLRQLGTLGELSEN